MKIAIASDHGGFLLKAHLINFLKQFDSYNVKDLGSYTQESVDYTKIARNLALVIQKKQAEFGILICGSGVGVSIVANRYKGVRAVNCTDQYVARMSREHNNANVICFGERNISFNQAEVFLKIFLETTFSNEQRHQQRVNNIDSF